MRSTHKGVKLNSSMTVEVTRRLEPLQAATESLGLKDTRVTMRLVREGKLKALKIGNRVMITTASLNAFTGA